MIGTVGRKCSATGEMGPQPGLATFSLDFRNSEAEREEIGSDTISLRASRERKSSIVRKESQAFALTTCRAVEEEEEEGQPRRSAGPITEPSLS